MIYLLRHGETVWNSRGRKQGQKDSPLTWKGINQARTCGDLLARRLARTGDSPSRDLRPSDFTMISSPLGRAWQTATIVADALGREPDAIHHDPRLMEIRFGAWEGLTWDQIEASDSGVLEHRSASRWTHRPPGGESYADVAERVGAWLAEQTPDARLIVVAHGLLNRVLRGLYSGLTHDEIFTLDEPQDAVFLLNGGSVERLDS